MTDRDHAHYKRLNNSYEEQECVREESCLNVSPLIVGSDTTNAGLDEVIQNLGILVPSVPTIANESGDDMPVLERGQ